MIELIIYVTGCILSFILLNLHMYLLRKKYDLSLLPQIEGSSYLIGTVICTILSWLGVAYVLYSLIISKWKKLL